MLFSIIICTHNSKDKLPKTLDSIWGQDFSDFEVVVVDGASADGTVEILKEYEKKFSGRLRWISEPDSGIYNAMNKGARLAEGDFLNVVGAGDWMEPGALKAVGDWIKGNPQASAVYGRTRIWSEDLKESRIFQSLVEDLPFQPMQHPALYYRCNCHEKFGFYDESYAIAADYLFCLKVFWAGRTRAERIDPVVVNFVLDGVSSQKKWRCRRETWRARREMGLRSNLWFDLKNEIKHWIKK